MSSILVLAFVVPLCALVRSTAEDRAKDQALADVGALVPVVAVSGDPSVVASAAATTISGQANRLIVATTDLTLLGGDPTAAMLDALDQGRSLTIDTGPQLEVIRVVLTADGALTAIAGIVPEAERRKGVFAAWAVLGATGLVLVALATLVTDRLGRTVVRSIESLSDAAVRLGAGDLGVRVEPSEVEELDELGRTFNALGSQVDGMLEREREVLATMSHRLRTPLTRLRLRADQIDDLQLADALRSDVDDTAIELTRMIAETRRSIEDRSEASKSCDVQRVVEQRLRFWRVLADEQNRELTSSLPDSPNDSLSEPPAGPHVRLGEPRLREIVDLLVDNVFAHSGADAGLDVSLRIGSTTAELTISNRLVAIDEPAGSRSLGSGIGHHIIRGHLDEIGGRLSVGAVDGRYLANVVLPRLSPEAPEALKRRRASKR